MSYTIFCISFAASLILIAPCRAFALSFCGGRVLRPDRITERPRRCPMKDPYDPYSRSYSSLRKMRNSLSRRRKSTALFQTSVNGEFSQGTTTREMPQISSFGVYQIKNEDQYNNFLRANPNKLVVMKFYANYCRACKALQPQFLAVKNDPQLRGLPVVWAEFMSARDNLEIFQRLNVLALPTVHFYDGQRGLVENFPCGVAKIPLLKQKLALFLNSRVDPRTLQLKEGTAEQSACDITTPCAERYVLGDTDFITDEHIRYLRYGMPFFSNCTDEEFQTLLSKAKLLTFNPGDLVIRQGMPPKTFYVIKSGAVEMSIKSRFDDPITTPPNYLGVVVNELRKFDYFGERALTTGEPYSATCRVVEKMRCFAFNVDDIPDSSILSKTHLATREMIEQISQRYELPKDYFRPHSSYLEPPRDKCVLELLVRFKQIRQAAKCFEYVMKKSQPKWGNAGEITRRSMLVNKLSKTQIDEFEEVFRIVDKNGTGKISLLEMRQFMESARNSKSTQELMEMIARANNLEKGREAAPTDFAISHDEFMGVMAEAEFYNLFTETFNDLDEENTGYVRAGDLDEVLGGVRNLIWNDRTNIIDVEDKDMLVDYEQFSKMLLGAAL